MKSVEERIEPTGTVQTEFDEWIADGLSKAEEIISNSDNTKE